MNGIQFPTIDGTEAGWWCPTGSGVGTHNLTGYHLVGGQIAARSAAFAASLAECEKGGFHEKMLKAVVKEGGKKGIEISGAADMGGLEFFNTIIEQCKAKVCMVELAMHAMNKDIDPEEEESKGGSAEVGKVLIAPGETDIALVAYVPDDKVGKVQAGKWIRAILDKWEVPHSCIITDTDTWCSALHPCDAKAGQFALKLKETALQGGINYLREVGAFPEGDESDNDECYANEFEW